ncbi:hypothetical protein GY45DRAFT_177285 [Cubamyces sp. BRFM 1775]|nr:hypothetical protein GY45DRAFT_177285 [Cubamyces sp. BRFM 1775]
MSDVLLILNSLAFSAFACLRLYGVWGRDWKPLIVVLPLTLVQPILGIYEAARYTPLQAGPPFGCVRVYNLADSVLFKCSYASSAILIATEVIVIILTWIKTFGIIRDSQLGRGTRTPLPTLLLRDGTAYFLFTFVAQLPTLIPGGVLLGNTIWIVWFYFVQVLPIIVVSRFILNLRGLYFSDRPGCDSQVSLHLSDMRFPGISAADVVGNLGATLMLPMQSHEYGRRG